MTNLLDLVPAFQRQVGKYTDSEGTESLYAAYLADAVQALMFRWERGYLVEFISPQTYLVDPTIEQKDYRPIILMASIIYKAANVPLAAFQDGDFSYNPLKGISNPLEIDRAELLLYLGSSVKLAKAVSVPLWGYGYAFNREGYNRFISGGWITDGLI